MRRECRERFPRHPLQRKPPVSHPSMHHGTCVAHVPLCMSGSLTRGGGENVPGIPGACATRNFTYLVWGPWISISEMIMLLWQSKRALISSNLKYQLSLLLSYISMFAFVCLRWLYYILPVSSYICTYMKKLFLFPSLLYTLLYVPIIGHVITWRSYSFACTFSYLVIMIIQTYLKALNMYI